MFKLLRLNLYMRSYGQLLSQFSKYKNLLRSDNFIFTIKYINNKQCFINYKNNKIILNFFDNKDKSYNTFSQ